MNKKKLSVVMAGAMLATSVAPVLAAETNVNEVSQGKIGLFIDRLETLMESKKFDANDRNLNSNGSDNGVSAYAGKSVYAIQILKNGTTELTSVGTSAVNADITSLQITDKKTVNLYSSDVALKALKKLTEDFAVGTDFYTVKVYELGNTTDASGRIVSTEASTKDEAKVVNYTDGTGGTFAQLLADAEESKKVSPNRINFNFTGLYDAIDNGYVVSVDASEDEKEVTITLGSKDDNGEFNKIKCAVGTPQLVFAKPVDKYGKLISDKGEDYIQANIAGFEYKTDSNVPAGTISSIVGKKAKVAHEVKVVNGDVNYTVKVDDLYDGFMLTEKGHELINAIRAYDNDKKAATTATVDSSVVDGKGTERVFNVTFEDTANKTKTIVKVVGDSLHESRATTLRKWLYARVADVELLAGDNRYSTAVEIAKTYLAGASQYSWDENSELVLVNGEALVDGLAAAPYAKKQGAPILLTAENSLPKETKAYMKELIAKKQVGDLNNKAITVTIVGGEAVVSQSVVNELKEIGFKVKRISGDNREETSLAVADKIGTTAKAYVVGAFGEADAMSIAAEASRDKDASTAGFQTTPIIVAKSANGLSTVGLNEVSEFTEVEIVGGEGVLPKENEDAIKELIDDETKVTRINGKNRQETNALVIKKYHKGFNDALIAKDGTRNKSKLIDALPAAIFASSNSATNPSAPIVLATDKISDEQINQLVLNADKDNAKTVYQIGNGVAKSVMEKVVTKLGLNK